MCGGRFCIEKKCMQAEYYCQLNICFEINFGWIFSNIQVIKIRKKPSSISLDFHYYIIFTRKVKIQKHHETKKGCLTNYRYINPSRKKKPKCKASMNYFSYNSAADELESSFIFNQLKVSILLHSM